MTKNGTFTFNPDLDPAAMYDEYGFAIIQLMDEEQAKTVEAYGREWLNGLITDASGGSREHLPLDQYHLWWEREGVPHSSMLGAKNRHRAPVGDVQNLLTGVSLEQFLIDIGIAKYRIWDEGLGWLAFRFIRPGMNDGYPWSCKAWGPAKTVLSLWVPVIGLTPDVTLHLIPGSHKKTYERHLPEEQQFCKDEYRLVKTPAQNDIFSPTLRLGEAIIYHPRTLHTEDVEHGMVTRLNLEFRVEPLR